MKPVAQIDSKQLQRIKRSNVAEGFFKEHYEQIERQLRSLGAVRYDLSVPETHVLPLIIHLDEQIEGVVYGRYHQDQIAEDQIIGRGVLVATDQRILLIDHKPMFMKCDEISYSVVSGVSYGKVGFIGTVVLHTRLGDISVRTFNQRCARSFVEAVEGGIATINKEVTYEIPNSV
jgi:hypothetical protein